MNAFGSSLPRVSLLAFVSLSLLTSTGQAQVTLEKAKILFNKNCASCHGEDMRGGMTDSLLDGRWYYGSNPEDLFRNIKYGISNEDMPAFGSLLSDDEIRAIVELIRSRENDAKPRAKPTKGTFQSKDYSLEAEIIADNLTIPWAIDFLPDGSALITERPGKLRLLTNNQLHPDPIAGTPEVLHHGQGGLLDVAIDPDYENNGWIYLAYSHPLPGNSRERPLGMTRIVRGRIQNHQWVDEEVLYEADPSFYLPAGHHYGSRIVFDRDGYLYFSIGDRGQGKEAQNLSTPYGKIHRINRDGSIPADNPFLNHEGALPTIYSYGSRNPQGLAVHPETGVLWETEHGPKGGDELNIIEAAKNYGWPEVTYGINYNDTIISEHTHMEGMEQPVIHWTPSIAVCGINFYTGDLFPKWKNQLFVTALAHEEVRRLQLDGDKVVEQEVVIKGAGRVRDVATGPDGALYVVLNNPHAIIRVSPAR